MTRLRECSRMEAATIKASKRTSLCPSFERRRLAHHIELVEPGGVLVGVASLKTSMVDACRLASRIQLGNPTIGLQPGISAQVYMSI